MTKITNSLLGLLSVNEGNIIDNAISADKISDNAIVGRHLSANIDAAFIQSETIVAALLASNSIVERHYSDNSIPRAAIKNDAISAAKIADNTITNTQMAAGTITATEIKDDTITIDKMADDSVGTSQLINDSVTNVKIAPNAVTEDKISLTSNNKVLYADGTGNITGINTGSDTQVLTLVGGAPVWASGALPTGLVCPYYGNTAPSGWVIADGSTLGSTASSADNASDTNISLFFHLWNTFSNTEAPVVEGRGASAQVDWDANKSITLPDLRGRSIFGIETDTDNSTGRITPSEVSTGNNASVASVGGSSRVALTEDDIPAHQHKMFVDGIASDVNTLTPSGITSIYDRSFYNGSQATDTTSNYQHGYSPAYSEPTLGLTSKAGATGVSESNPQHSNMPPFMLMNMIIKV